MSIVTNAHDVVEYVSSGANKSAAFTGQRLAVIGFKGGEIKSQCVSLPELSITADEWEALKPYCVNWLESVQDKIIRAAILNGERVILDSMIDVASICESLDAESESSRLTKEAIAAWYDLELATALASALKSKAPAATDEQINASVAAYKEKITSLSGGRTGYSIDVLNMLAKALAYAANSVIGARLQAKIAAMIKKVQEDQSNAMLAL